MLAPPTGVAPDFKVATHADQPDLLVEFGGIAQLGGNEDAAGAVEFAVTRVAHQDALERGGTRIEARGSEDALAYRCPGRFRIEQQATVRVSSQDEASFALLGEGVTMPGRNCQPSLGVERKLRCPLKHPSDSP